MKSNYIPSEEFPTYADYRRNYNKVRSAGYSAKYKERVKLWAETNSEEISAKKKAHYEANKDEVLAKQREYLEKNREDIRARARARADSRRDEVRERSLAYCEANREQIRKKQREYYAANKERLQTLAREYVKANADKLSEAERRRYAIDPQYRLRRLLRGRLWGALKGGVKKGSAVKLLGCPVPIAIAHLESKFEPGMSWDTHGAWHIDHIKPLAAFDLEDSEQLAQACHYTNLQPLWAFENLSKSDKFDAEVYLAS